MMQAWADTLDQLRAGVMPSDSAKGVPGGRLTATSDEYQTIMSDQSEKLSSVSEASGVAPAARPL